MIGLLPDPVCDKCGEDVAIENDAVSLDIVLYIKHGAALEHAVRLTLSQPRHLLPTENCPGSPSRAQYIEGQPRDTRPEYPYNETAETMVREAYETLLQNAAMLNDR